ncbi:MAG TPA: hypothetical protein VNK89_04820 [Thermoflexus sp.]|nr:hypothetical protein [Thermoflexus sp.]
MRLKLVFLLLLFGLAGCAAPGVSSPAPTPETTLPFPTGSLASSTPGPTPASIAPFSTQEPVEAWKRVSDDGYKYSFEVPATWIQDEEAATPDRLMFFSDPTVVGKVGPLTLPNGLIKLDFAADPIGKGEPDLTGANPITVAGRPAWIISEEGSETAGPSSFNTVVYILGSEYWYTLWLGCTPPFGADAKVTDRFIAECRQILDHILNSFQIMQ